MIQKLNKISAFVNTCNYRFKMKKELKQMQSNLFSFRKAFTIVIILNLVSDLFKYSKWICLLSLFFSKFFLQIFLLERSIFDFMGFMYGMIIADICYLVFLIIGLFGAYQYRVNYVAAVSFFFQFSS